MHIVENCGGALKQCRAFKRPATAFYNFFRDIEKICKNPPLFCVYEV